MKRLVLAAFIATITTGSAVSDSLEVPIIEPAGDGQAATCLSNPDTHFQNVKRGPKNDLSFEDSGSPISAERSIGAHFKKIRPITLITQPTYARSN